MTAKNYDNPKISIGIPTALIQSVAVKYRMTESAILIVCSKEILRAMGEQEEYIKTFYGKARRPRIR